MHTIRLNNKIFSGPSKWTELTADTLLSLAVCTGTVSHYTRAFLVMTLFKVPQKLFTRLKECQVIQLEPLIQWTSTKNIIQKWLIKSVKVSQITLYGPQNRLADLTIEEFTYCEAAYERWLQSQKTEFLDTLFAVLYRRQRFFGTKRLDFDADRLGKHEKRAKNVRIYIKRAIAINYAGCRNFIIDSHPFIWVPADPQDQAAVGAVHRPTNWVQLVLNLSGDKFGTYQQTTKVNLWLVLADFNKKAKDIKELEASIKK
jgi:hypothetical protein